MFEKTGKQNNPDFIYLYCSVPLNGPLRYSHSVKAYRGVDSLNVSNSLDVANVKRSQDVLSFAIKDAFLG